MRLRTLGPLLAGLLFALTVWAAENLSFRDVVITIGDDQRILVDAQIGYALNDTASEALENGVPLTFETHIQVRSANAWIWDKDVVEHRLRAVLRYHPLSSLYEVRHLEQDSKELFSTRHAALEALGRIDKLSIVNRADLKPGGEYVVSLEVFLDIESLPMPMRPKAYLSSDWDIESEPWEWRLNL